MSYELRAASYEFDRRQHDVRRARSSNPSETTIPWPEYRPRDCSRNTNVRSLVLRFGRTFGFGCVAGELHQTIDERGLNLNDEGENFLALFIADTRIERSAHILAATLGGVGGAFLQRGKEKAGGCLFGAHAPQRVAAD